MRDPKTGALLTVATPETNPTPVVAPTAPQSAAPGVPALTLSPKVATVLGAVASALAVAAAFIPPPWGALAGVVAFVVGALAGLSLPAPKFLAGRPVLQGTALTVTGGAVPFLAQLGAMLPEGWPRAAANGLALLGAVLAGLAAPQLGGGR